MYDLDAGKRLAEAARKALEGTAPEPWVYEQNGRRGAWIKSSVTDEWVALSCGDTDKSATDHARFIAYARSGVPALAADLLLAHAEIERLRERLERVYTIIRDDDLSEPIADNGMTVLDGLQNEARALLGDGHE